MRVNYMYGQRDISVECHTSSIHGCVMYLLLSRKGVPRYRYGSLSGEKGLCIKCMDECGLFCRFSLLVITTVYFADHVC